MAQVNRISHIGIACHNAAEHRSYYEDVLGLTCAGQETVLDQQVRVTMYEVGDSRIELLEPTADTSPIAKFLEKRGEGIHHIAYDVTDIGALLQRAQENQIKLIDAEAKVGAGGHRIAFLHPKSTFGVLTEFCEADGSK